MRRLPVLFPPWREFAPGVFPTPGALSHALFEVLIGFLQGTMQGDDLRDHCLIERFTVNIAKLQQSFTNKLGLPAARLFVAGNSTPAGAHER